MQEKDSFPRPVSDPEVEGIPDYADEDSTAWDDVESPRWADGPDPAPVPLDRDDGPLALDEFGTTAEEQRRGEPLNQRLAREEPDVSPDPVPIGMLDDAPVVPHPDSPVSTYETLGEDPITHGQVGRLVAPDEGSGIDEERDAVGYDAGAAGGAPSAEETAMHEVRDDDIT